MLQTLLARFAERPLRWAALLGILLFLPALAVPFAVDDWWHLAMLEGNPILEARSSWDLFRFSFEGSDAGPIQGSIAPWWASDGFRAVFFRPLTSLSHAVDHAVWGRWAVGHHVTSLLLYGVLAALSAALFRNLGGTGALVGALAAVLYVVDDSHAWPVAWLASRNSLLAVIFSVATLLAHRKWRAGGGGWLPASLLFFSLGLLSGEAAFATVAFIAAHELVLGQGRGLRRMLPAPPAVAVAALYLVLWKLGGYGTHDSGMYLDPFARPGRFIGFALPTRIPLMLLAALTPLQVDMSFLLTDAQMVFVGAGAAALVALLLWPMWGVIRRDRVSQFLLLGGLGALIPVAATFPAARLLLLPGLAIAWVVARYVTEAWSGRANLRFASLLLLFHLVLAPLGALGGTGFFGFMANWVNSEATTLELPEEGVEQARVFFLNAPSPMTSLYVPVIRAVLGLPAPAGWFAVSQVPGQQELTRTGERSFRLRAAPPGFLVTPFELLTRPAPDVSEELSASRGILEVSAAEVVDGQLLALDFTIDLPLDDPDVHLVAYDGTRIARWHPPEVGGCASVDFPMSVPVLREAKREPPAGLCGAAVQTESPLLAAAEAAEPCSLDLLKDGSWLPLQPIACPGPEGLGVVALGDIGLPGDPLTNATAQIAARCGAEPCHLVTLAGDLMYVPGSGAETAWARIWDDTLAKLRLPGVGVLGNHEYRHEPDPEGKRAALYGANGRAGFHLPSASWTMRISRSGESLIALVGLDTDSVANPVPGMPGLGEQALVDGCALGLPTLVVGHHPLSSQGLHHRHEAHIEQELAGVLREARAGGCRISAYLAGHDHDLQVWPAGCEQAGNPGTVVSGVAARGYRPAGSDHLEPCPSGGQTGSYHAGRPGVGFAIVRVQPATGDTTATLYDVPAPGQHVPLDTVSWKGDSP